MSATKKIPAKTRGVKAKVKVGKVNRVKKPELTDAEIDAIVQQALADESLLSRASALAVDTVSVLGAGVSSVLSTLADAIQKIASGVWAFLGRVYNAFAEAVAAMVAWVKEMANAAYGRAKKALTAVHALVSSMNVSDINAGMLKLVSWLTPTFHVEGFWTAIGGALVLSIVGALLNWFLQPERNQVRVQVHRY